MGDHPRSRERGDTISRTAHLEQTNHLGALQTAWDRPYVANQWSETTDDVVHGNFQRRSARGDIVSGPFTRTYDSRSWHPVPVNQEYVYTYVVWNWGMPEVMTSGIGWAGSVPAQVLMQTQGANYAYTEPTLFPVSDTLLGDMADKAHISCKAGVSDSAVNLGENLSEFRQTVDLLKKIAVFSGKVGSVVDSRAKIATLKPTKGNIRAATDAWLSYRYGLRPLVGELTGLLEYLTSAYAPRYTSRATEIHYDREIGDESVHWIPGDLPSGYVFRQATKDLKVVVTSGAMYAFENRDAERLMAFGWNDLWTLGWELVPYSFVIDWFFRVGDWLKAFAPTVGVSVLNRWTTTVIENRVTESLRFADTESSANTLINRSTTSNGYFERVWKQTHREIHSRWVLPRLPVTDVSLDVSKLIDTQALLMRLHASATSGPSKQPRRPRK